MDDMQKYDIDLSLKRQLAAGRKDLLFVWG